MRAVEITWRPLNATVTIELTEHRNAALADALWHVLPYRSLQIHALVAGQHLYHVAPAHDLLHIPAPYRIDRRQVPDGTVFCSQLQHLGIKYGVLTEPMTATPIGRVSATDIETLRSVGRAVWEEVYQRKRWVIAEVRRATTDGGHSIPRLHASSPEAEELIRALHAETERIWLEPPRELSELHMGRIPSKAGTYGTVLPTLVFVNGETRPLGYATYSGLVRAALTTDTPIESLRTMVRVLAKTPAEFLGYCGLQRLEEFTERILAALDAIPERNDLAAVLSHMALYVNCLGAWNLQLFPWQLGDHFRQTGDSC